MGQPGERLNPWSNVKYPKKTQAWKDAVAGKFRMPYVNPREADRESGMESSSKNAFGQQVNADLIERYGMDVVSDPKKLKAAIHADFGIPGYATSIARVTPKTEVDQYAAQFMPGQQAILINDRFAKKDPGSIPQSLYHELAHAAENISNPYSEKGIEFYRPERGDLPDDMAWNEPPLPGSPPHFGEYNNRYELFRDLNEQQRIQRGETPNSDLLARNPWLKKVVPFSSNMLAAPWKENMKKNPWMKIPEKTWNNQFRAFNAYEEELKKEKEYLKQKDLDVDMNDLDMGLKNR